MRGFSLALWPLSLLVSISEASKSYNVTVGKGGQLKFDPETLTASVGDTITYQFFARVSYTRGHRLESNHAVAQSSFNEPCQPLAGGVFSGFTPNLSPDVASPTTFTITVNDTKPIWIYCPQTNGDHCQKGMVHSINAPSSGNTFEAYKSKAATAPTSKSPADGLPVGGLRLLSVEVGAEGKLTFTPNNITELQGTVVRYNFNPKNHSVVQSSFNDPCHPLDKGFTSGFIPTAVSPSGAHFDIVVPDTKPIWFYCAQTTGNHCQTGMVGSINAPAAGNTLEAFIELAKKAGPSTIPPQAPLGGILSVNGTIITSLDGNQLKPGQGLDKGTITDIPPPGGNMSSYVWNTAGGGQPDSYNWATGISDNATSFLQLLEFLDNILLTALIEGHAALSAGGKWANVYPKTIVDTIGTLSAQALVHRATATDSLQHYDKPLVGTCTYTIPADNVDQWLESTLHILLLETGVMIDVIALSAATDSWLVPALATQIGAKARMTAVVNMMQNHIAAAAPREAMVPSQLAWSYASQHWASNCQGQIANVGVNKAWPKLEVVSVNGLGSTTRTGSVTFKLEGDWTSSNPGGLWIAWIAAWGTLRFTPVAADGSANVPTELYGHVWAVLVNKGEGKVRDLVGITVAGPELVWVSQP
ncbi:hypothetical protein GE09DRAFT_1033114 [Coniochaeta sp. 2T2.1]|nr:hypothetical protein GE09DRAFT_1033114 [Coniochaeta sp. 2T2.1]